MKSPENFEKEKQITIESAKPEDAAGIAHVRNETWLATYPNEKAGVTREDILSKNFESEKEIGLWRKTIETTQGKRKLWVAKDGSVIVGYSQARRGDKQNEILGLYVLPKFHHKGLGSKLLKEALDWLGDEIEVTLNAAEYSTAAIKLYEKFGFEPAFVDLNEPIKGPSFESGSSIPTIKMIRRGK